MRGRSLGVVYRSTPERTPWTHRTNASARNRKPDSEVRKPSGALRCELRNQSDAGNLRFSCGWIGSSQASLRPQWQERQTSCNLTHYNMESGGFCCQVPPNPACRSLTRQDFKIGIPNRVTRPGQPEHSCRLQLWIGPITVEPCRAKARPLRPRRSCFAPVSGISNQRPAIRSTRTITSF